MLVAQDLKNQAVRSKESIWSGPVGGSFTFKLIIDMSGNEKHAPSSARFSFLLKLLVAFATFCLLVNYVVGLNMDSVPVK